MSNEEKAFPSVVQYFPEDTNYWLQQGGMTLRDYFAAKTPTDEIQEYLHRHLSRLAMEQLAGRKYPEEPKEHSGRSESLHIERLRFYADVNAAIRYVSADAMLAAREKTNE